MIDNPFEIVAFSSTGPVGRSYHHSQVERWLSNRAMGGRQQPAITDDDRTADVCIFQIAKRSLEWKLATTSLQTTDNATGLVLCVKSLRLID